MRSSSQVSRHANLNLISKLILICYCDNRTGQKCISKWNYLIKLSFNYVKVSLCSLSCVGDCGHCFLNGKFTTETFQLSRHMIYFKVFLNTLLQNIQRRGNLNLGNNFSKIADGTELFCKRSKTQFFIVDCVDLRRTEDHDTCLEFMAVF